MDISYVLRFTELLPTPLVVFAHPASEAGLGGSPTSSVLVQNSLQERAMYPESELCCDFLLTCKVGDSGLAMRDLKFRE